MRALVTGGAGFIGSHMVDYLIEKGHDVVVIDSLITGDKKNINPRAKFIEGDIRNNITLPKDHIDWVFNFAAIARTQWTIEDPKLAHEINATGTLNMLIAARDAKVKKFIHSSSCIVYVPTTPYYVSKKAAEEYVSIFPSLYGLSTISLRYSNVYGSLRQSEKGPHINFIASFRKSLRDNGYIWITGDGKQTRDLIHVDDVVRANYLAATSEKEGTFDICTGIQTSILDIAKRFKGPIEYLDERKGDVMELVQDPTNAEKVLGFKAEKKLWDNIGVYLK